MREDLTTRGMLERMCAGPDGDVGLGDLLDRFRERAFGVFLLLGLLPAFLPLPTGAGAISGPLVMLAGLQLLAQAEHPWLPMWLQRRRVAIASIERFRHRLARPLAWLERISRPRWHGLIETCAARAFTGLLLIVLGLLLALPIPLTNYPFGIVLLVFAIALIEDDGRTMAFAWALGLIEIGVAVVFFEEAAGILHALVDRVAAGFQDAP